MIETIFILAVGWTVAGAWEDNTGYASMEFDFDEHSELHDLATLNTYPQALAARPAIPAMHSKYRVGKIGGSCN